MKNEKLIALRRERKITQSQMAEALGYKNKSGYCQLENGIVKMTIDKAEKIANYLGICAAEIFFNN